MPGVISYRPNSGARNPPRTMTMDAGLRGFIVRLEAPDEFDGDWSGPVYVRLGRIQVPPSD